MEAGNDCILGRRRVGVDSCRRGGRRLREPLPGSGNLALQCGHLGLLLLEEQPDGLNPTASGSDQGICSFHLFDDGVKPSAEIVVVSYGEGRRRDLDLDLGLASPY